MTAIILLFAFSTSIEIPHHYVMYGRIETNADTRPFVVAVTPERALSGSRNASGTSLSYTGSHEQRVQIDLELDDVTTMDHPSGHVQMVMLTNGVVGSTPADHRMGIEMASYSKVPFALFFSSAYVGVPPEMLASGGAQKNTCGELRVITEPNGAVRAIEFEQQEQNLLTARLANQTLADTIHPYPEGLKHILYKTTFSPPFDGKTAAWECNCLLERTTRKGQVERNESRVIVTRFSSDLAEVNAAIDEYLALVPDAEPVIANEDSPLSYIWKNGKVVRHLDQSAIAIAADAEFTQATRAPWWYMCIVGAVIVGVITLLLRRRS